MAANDRSVKICPNCGMPIMSTSHSHTPKSRRNTPKPPPPRKGKANY